MNVLKVCSILVSIIPLDVFGACSVNGYYWRDYTGKIPKDAVPGGRQRDGKRTYIGQVFHGSKLVPGRIVPQDDQVYFPWLRLEFVVNNRKVKILCSQNRYKFKWVKTKHSEMNLLTKGEVVLGGYEPGYILYIGRVFHQMETVTGKIVTAERGNENLGLFISYEGIQMNFLQFEVLMYNESS